MEIRTAIPGDLDELMDFYAEMSRALDKQDFLPHGNRGGFPSREMVADAIRTEGQFVGVEDGRIMAACFLSHDCDKSYETAPWSVRAPREQVAVLHALRVLPAYGGRGYSRQLMEYAIRAARARGQKTLRLDCARGNDVPVRLYRSCGFREVGTAVITYEDIGEPMEFRLFELAL